MAALGLSLIFGTTGLTNFAHGELVTFGAHHDLRRSTSCPGSIDIGGPDVTVILAVIAAFIVSALSAGSTTPRSGTRCAAAAPA